jgi:uncharacterized membrane protein YkvA (DUF1232 family)
MGSMGERLRRIVALLSDPRTPRLPRAAVILAVIYLIWPLDLMPDFLVPIVGYFDDLTLVWIALRWLLKSGPTTTGGGPEQLPSPPPEP